MNASCSLCLQIRKPPIGIAGDFVLPLFAGPRFYGFNERYPIAELAGRIRVKELRRVMPLKVGIPITGQSNNLRNRAIHGRISPGVPESPAECRR